MVLNIHRNHFRLIRDGEKRRGYGGGGRGGRGRLYTYHYTLSLSPPLPYPRLLPPFSSSLISLMVSVDVKNHVYLLTVTTRMIPALRIRWAMMRAILIFHIEEVMGKVTGPCSVHKPPHFQVEQKVEPKRYRTKVLPLTSLTPYRLAKLDHQTQSNRFIYIYIYIYI